MHSATHRISAVLLQGSLYCMRRMSCNSPSIRRLPCFEHYPKPRNTFLVLHRAVRRRNRSTCSPRLRRSPLKVSTANTACRKVLHTASTAYRESAVLCACSNSIVQYPQYAEKCKLPWSLLRLWPGASPHLSASDREHNGPVRVLHSFPFLCFALHSIPFPFISPIHHAPHALALAPALALGTTAQPPASDDERKGKARVPHSIPSLASGSGAGSGAGSGSGRHSSHYILRPRAQRTSQGSPFISILFHSLPFHPVSPALAPALALAHGFGTTHQPITSRYERNGTPEFPIPFHSIPCLSVPLPTPVSGPGSGSWHRSPKHHPQP
jgi:hypothetical protein